MQKASKPRSKKKAILLASLPIVGVVLIFIISMMTVPSNLNLDAKALPEAGPGLPSPRDGASAAWDGKNAYLFGGRSGSKYFDQILRFSPSTNTVSIMSAKLPSARTYTSVIWNGTYIFIFGGRVNKDFRDQVLRYDIATDTVSVITRRCPAGEMQLPRSGTANMPISSAA